NLGKYVGAIPVARPFRDDSKELLRAGKLRDIVNEQWEILLQGIRQGRKLFLFPEGTFTNDGSIGQIRKGIFFLQEKISDLNLFPLTLTYDYLSEKKPIVHVGYGKIFRLKPGMNEQEVAIELRRILNLTFTLTPANLFSFAILTEEFKSGIGRHFLFYKMKKMAEDLERNQILYISRELLIKSYDELFADILANAKNTGFIELLENKKYRGTEKLFSSIDIQDTGGKRKIRKINPYLYHCNQLKSIQNDLNKIWKNIEVYD
ncbi:MAG: hypothetical protein IT569_07715, partial [Leptospiraceae bacterium]|nr:hypothetical protein [Leptospiraceae bacterium]